MELNYQPLHQNNSGKTALHEAVIKNDVSEIEELLTQLTDIEARDNAGKTPLHDAAFYNVDESHFQVAEILLINGADPNARDNMGLTPLYQLVQNGNIKILKLFLDFKADIKVVPHDGENLLFPAVGQNYNNPEVVQLLVDSGLNVNQHNLSGMTPLQAALFYNKNESSLKVISEVLLKNGANADLVDNSGNKPIYYFLQNGDSETIKLFYDRTSGLEVINNKGENLLFPAVQNSKNVEIVQLLLDKGLNVNQRTGYGTTPLHQVAIKNEDESLFQMAEILLKNKADVNSQDVRGLTPIYYLVRKSSLKMVELFLNFNASVSEHDHNLLFNAVHNHKNAGVVQLLVNLGLNINVVNNKGDTLLFSAAYNNESLEVLQLLVSLGLDVNHRNTSQSTPMHYACARESINIDIIKFLLRSGASMDAKNDHESTPLIEVIHNVNKDVFEDGIPKKILNFLMDHTDLNVIYGNHDILHFTLNTDSNTVDNQLYQIILEHLAKLQSLDLPLHLNTWNSIYTTEVFNNYYELCTEELSRAKNTKLPNSWLTYFNLLVDERKKIKNYVGNEDLIKDFNKNDWTIKFPIYGYLMDENVKKGIRRRELLEESSIILSNFLPLLNPNHLIIRDIFDCVLSKKDLSKFCKSN